MTTVDLSDTDLAEMVGDGTLIYLPFVRAALELQRHRSAVAADGERVRSVVEQAALASLDESRHWAFSTGTHLTINLATAIADRAAKQLAGAAPVASAVPPAIAAGLDRYAQHAIPPGDCLRHVLEGDLFGAFARADPTTAAAMPAIVAAITSRLHSSTWGSPEAVSRYIERARDINAAGDRKFTP